MKILKQHLKENGTIRFHKCLPTLNCQLENEIIEAVKQWLQQKPKPGWCNLDDWELMKQELLEELEK